MWKIFLEFFWCFQICFLFIFSWKKKDNFIQCINIFINDNQIDSRITVLQQFSEDYRKSFERGKTDDDNDEPLAKKAKQIQLEEVARLLFFFSICFSAIR